MAKGEGATWSSSQPNSTGHLSLEEVLGEEIKAVSGEFHEVSFIWILHILVFPGERKQTLVNGCLCFKKGASYVFSAGEIA